MMNGDSVFQFSFLLSFMRSSFDQSREGMTTRNQTM